MGPITKVNDLGSLFRDKNENGASDVDLDTLSIFWKEAAEKDKRSLLENLKAAVAKELGEE
jgi:hypothetical protein